MPFTGTLTKRITLDGYDFLAPAKFAGSLKGQVAVVTGSGRGIGKETALCLCRAGAKVAFFARNEQEVRAVRLAG
jgi:3-oxoacyl-[acyl-carrier protein] reductase